MNIAEEGEREKDNAEMQRTLRSAEIAIGMTLPCVLLAEKPGEARAEKDLTQRAQRPEHRGHGGGWAYLSECGGVFDLAWGARYRCSLKFW
jgi:hypothetical protein